MLVKQHSCTLTPSLVVLGLAPMTGATFSKGGGRRFRSDRRLGDASIVISSACPTVQGQKGQPNRSLEKSFMKGTVLELVSDTAKNTYRTLSLQNNWGTAAKPVLPYKSMGARDWQIVTF